MLTLRQIRFLLICIICSCATTFGQSPVFERGLPNSLKFAPGDASFYYASTNNRLKWDQLVNSEAFVALAKSDFGARSISVLRDKGIDELKQELLKLDEANLSSNEEQSEEAEINRKLVKIIEFFESEQGRPLLELGIRMLGTEIFVFGDGSYSESMASMQAEQRRLMPLILKSPTAASEDPNLYKAMQIPTTVAGARLKDPADRDFIQLQLIRWEPIIRNAIREATFLTPAEREFLASHIQRRKLSDTSNHLVLQFSIDDYPWDAAIQRFEDMNAELGIADNEAPSALESLQAAKTALAGKELVVSLGTIGEYAMATLSGNDQHLRNPISSEPLYKNESFKPVVAAKDKVLSGIGYQSSKLKQASSWVNNVELLILAFMNLSDTAAAQNQLDALETAETERVTQSEMKQLIADLQETYNPAGDSLALGYFFSNGIANVEYSYRTEPIKIEGQTLESLKHVGTDPALVIAGINDSATKRMLKKWLPRLQQLGLRYLDAAKEQIEENEDQAKDDPLEQLLSKMYSITLDEFVASHGKESAFVLDFSQIQSQWHPALPPSQGLPLPAPALVYAVNDATLFRNAWKHYYEAINAATEENAVSFLPPGQPLPPTIEQPFPGGTYLRLPMIEMLGLHRSFQPGVAMTRDWAIYSLFPSQAESLATPQAPRMPPPLSDFSRPMISATYIDFSQWIDAVRAWHQFAMSNAGPELGGMKVDGGNDTFWDKNFGDLTYLQLNEAAIHLMEFARSLRSYSRATYVEGNAFVTQSAYYFSGSP